MTCFLLVITISDVFPSRGRMADESASFLRGLELQMSVPLMHKCQSLDVGVPMSAAGPNASRRSTNVEVRWLLCRVGHNRVYAPYMTVYLVVSLPKIPCIHCVCTVLANPAVVAAQ